MVTNSSSPIKKSRRRIVLGGICVAIAAAILAGLELSNTTHIFHKASQLKTVTAGQETKGETANSQSGANQASSSSASSQPGDVKSNTGGSTTASPLLTPIGDFVSAHHVSVTTSITSVCTTTPGATCQVQFTKDGVTKSLPSQTTDRGGSTYWNNWKPSDYGITAGSWHIQATASLNGQTKSATDALDLVVAQ